MGPHVPMEEARPQPPSPGELRSRVWTGSRRPQRLLGRALGLGSGDQ